LPGDVFLRLGVEIVVERDRLALAERAVSAHVYFRTRHQKGADTFRIIRHDFFGDVILIAAIAIRIAAESGAADSSFESYLSVCVRLEEFGKDSLVAFLRDRKVTIGK
jgi:hypothetical protein